MRAHTSIPELSRRYPVYLFIVALSFMALLLRLWHLQIRNGNHYRSLSEKNFVKTRMIKTLRGRIHDRHGNILAENRPKNHLVAVAKYLAPEKFDELADFLELSPNQREASTNRLNYYRNKHPDQRFELYRALSDTQLAKIESKRHNWPHLSIKTVPARHYPNGTLGAHVLGYMGKVRENELSSETDNYRFGDLVGRFGIEKFYEDQLRGIRGEEKVVVNARGQRQGSSVAKSLIEGDRKKKPEPGHDIELTIDVNLQRRVERTMRRSRSGAAVVVDVRNGHVLASASWPTFDPGQLSSGISQNEANNLFNNPLRPLLDKVNQEHYFPGSTYKVIPAIAALEKIRDPKSIPASSQKVFPPEHRISCSGVHVLGQQSFRCGHAHGSVDLEDAIIESCNVYFYTLAERLGMDTLATYAYDFGLGATTGLGLNGEVPGFIPTKSWYSENSKEFRVGHTLNAAIGQGNVKATPLQIAMLYATIANGGKLWTPQIIKSISDQSGNLIQQFEPRLRRQVNVSDETLNFIRRALHGVVSNPKGTAHRSRIAGIEIAGKTGTAQVVKRGQKKHEFHGDHAWFASFAPVEKPQIAVVVIAEHGGRASSNAAPLATQIIKDYFDIVQHTEDELKTEKIERDNKEKIL